MAGIADQLEKSIAGLQDALGMESPTWGQIKGYLLPNRKIAENMLISQGFTPEEAHAMVYGHTNLDDDTPNEKAMSEKSNLWKQIDQWKVEAGKAVNQLYAQSTRSAVLVATLTAESAMAIAAIANALATLPPQPAVAAYTAQQFNSTVTATFEEFKSIDPFLGPLSKLSILVAESAMTAVLTPIIVLIEAMTVAVTAIKMIPKISA